MTWGGGPILPRPGAGDREGTGNEEHSPWGLGVPSGPATRDEKVLNGILEAASGCLPHLHCIKGDTKRQMAGGRDVLPLLGLTPPSRAALCRISSSAVGCGRPPGEAGLGAWPIGSPLLAVSRTGASGPLNEWGPRPPKCPGY